MDKGIVLAGVSGTPSLPGWPRSTDQWNYAYAQHLERERQDGNILYWWYEPFSLWLPGRLRYKPDFLVQYPAARPRRLELVEVKGWSKNRRDGMTRYVIAAALFPCFSWKLAVKTRHGWDERRA